LKTFPENSANFLLLHNIIDLLRSVLNTRKTKNSTPETKQKHSKNSKPFQPTELAAASSPSMSSGLILVLAFQSEASHLLEMLASSWN
jgi:hypothetical protein